MFTSKKPFSAVSVAIDNLTSSSFEEDDMAGIPELVEAIKLQSTGPTEASRAIRKKLKYGNVHGQLRALAVLDALIRNAGDRFQRNFADEMLLERLRACGTSNLSDPAVLKKCKILYGQWGKDYANTRGLESIATLHKQLPLRKKDVTQQTSKVLRETDPFANGEDGEQSPTTPAASQSSKSTPSTKPPTPLSPSHTSSTFGLGKSSKDKEKQAKQDKKNKKGKKGGVKFNLATEKDAMTKCIAESSLASTNLMNNLRSINREQEQISQNKEAVTNFDRCKFLRKRVLYYINHVEAPEWLGPLLESNDKLIESLITYEHLDRSFDADSDSDDELAQQQHMYKMSAGKGKEPASDHADQLAGLTISPPPPPRPAPAEEEDDEEEDENDPFSDRNAVQTPAVERSEPTWN